MGACTTWATAMIDLLERGPVTVACNLAAQAQTVPLTKEQPAHILLASETGLSVNAAGVVVPAEALVILGADEC
jgi:hypothetical protein